MNVKPRCNDAHKKFLLSFCAKSPLDLLVHFHGHPPLVASNFIRSDLPGALVVLNERGLSSAYARPYRDPGAFESLLAVVRTHAGAAR